jgi:hypothetical protein
MASSNLLPNCIDLAPLVRRLMLPRVQGAEVGRTRGTAATVANAQAQAERLRPVLAELNHLSANATAAELARRGYATPRGGKWAAYSVIKLRNRLESAP